MKNAMVERTGDMSFHPVTLRPPDQLRLEVDEVGPYASLQGWLRATYRDRPMRFVDLLNADYGNGVWLEPQYRVALKAMEKADPPAAKITRRAPVTQTGSPSTGLVLDDTITLL